MFVFSAKSKLHNPKRCTGSNSSNKKVEEVGRPVEEVVPGAVEEVRLNLGDTDF